MSGLWPDFCACCGWPAVSKVWTTCRKLTSYSSPRCTSAPSRTAKCWHLWIIPAQVSCESCFVCVLCTSCGFRTCVAMFELQAGGQSKCISNHYLHNNKETVTTLHLQPETGNSHSSCWKNQTKSHGYFHICTCIQYMVVAPYFYRTIGTWWEMWSAAHFYFPLLSILVPNLADGTVA